MSNSVEIVRALVVSKSPECRSIVRTSFAQEPLQDWHLTECEDIACAKACLAKSEYELVVIDTNLDDAKWISSNSRESALVFLNLVGESPKLEDVLAAGATDFFSSAEFAGNPTNLWLALRQAIRYHAVQSRRRRVEELLKRRSVEVVQLTQKLYRTLPIDPRTGWLTHKTGLDRLAEEVYRAQRYKTKLTLVIAQFRGFPEFAIDFGQDKSDKALTEVAARVRTVTRQTDVIGHYGAEAFLVMLPGTDMEGARRFCQRVCNVFVDPIVVEDGLLRPEAFFGGAGVHLGATQQGTELLGQAESALEQALKSNVPGTAVIP